MVRSRDVKEAPRFNFRGKLRGHFHASRETFRLSHFCLYCSYLWSYYLKTDPTICTYNNSKILYKVKLYSNVFQWWTPPSSGKSTSTNQNTTVVSSLSYAHTDSRCVPINTELAEMRPVLMGTQSDSVCVLDKTDRQLTTALFWFIEVDFPDDGSVHHWNNLEYSLTVYKIFWIVMYSFCWISF